MKQELLALTKGGASGIQATHLHVATSAHERTGARSLRP